MFNLEREINRWKKNLGRGGRLEDGDIAELESHVRDEIRRDVQNGMDEETAFRRATADPDAEALQSEYGKIRLRAGWSPSRFMPALAGNAIKVALRKMRRQKGYSFINIGGLALGMACVLMIAFWIRDELSYDRFRPDAGRIYRINKEYRLGTTAAANSTTPFPLAPTLRSSFAEAEEATAFFDSPSVIRRQNRTFTEPSVGVADESFFKVFPAPFVRGEAASAWGDPGAMVISESAAERYFGRDDPIGQTLTVDGVGDFTVRGVMRNSPAHSDLRYDVLIPAAAFLPAEQREAWGSHYCQTFVRLRPGADAKSLEAKFPALLDARLPNEKIRFLVQPLTRIHLYREDGAPAGIKYVYFFAVIAVFILIIAVINFVNLSTARSEQRAKEVGLRKVVGADRIQLIRQFFGESMIFALAAALGALILVKAFQGPFNNLTGKNLNFSVLAGGILAWLAAAAVVTGIAAGAYPALVLSSFQPGRALRKAAGRKAGGRTFRKVLVILQFTVSTVLLIGTAVISRQIRFVRTVNPGYDSAGLAYLNMNDESEKKYEVLKSEWLQISGLAAVARSSELPGNVRSIIRGIRWPGLEPGQNTAFHVLRVDRDFLETMKIPLAAGRNFYDVPRSGATDVLVNETAARAMGMTDPIGKNFFAVRSDRATTIIGMVKDFHAPPLQYAIPPLVLESGGNGNGYSLILLRLRPGADVRATMDQAAAVWKKTVPGFPFEFRFLDDRFSRYYADEIRAEKLFQYFVLLAVVISCLGLLGLAAFTAEQKTREIGIRKILGASVPGVLGQLIKEFTQWVLWANAAAWPAAFLIMKGWLGNFAYRAPLAPAQFVGASLLSLAIAVLTVGAQALKAARANPGQSLRHE